MSEPNAGDKAKAAIQGALIPETVPKKNSDLHKKLGLYETRIGQAIPKSARDLNAARVIETASLVVSASEELRQCTVETVIGAVLTCSMLGFNPFPQLAEAYLIAYNRHIKDGTRDGKWVKECQLQIGYRGWLSLYYRSGLVKSVDAKAVYEQDDFSYNFGLRPEIIHKPFTGAAKDRGKLIHVYAIIRTIHGGAFFDVMTRDEIEALRLRSPMMKKYIEQGNSHYLVGPWKTDYEGMALAKVLKRIRRLMPGDSSLNQAYTVDERKISIDDFGNNQDGLNPARLEDIEEADAEVIETGVKRAWNGQGGEIGGEGESSTAKATKAPPSASVAQSVGTIGGAKEEAAKQPKHNIRSSRL
jgi:recombination protein RecT